MSEKYSDKHEARVLAVETLYALDFNGCLKDPVDLTLLPGKSQDEMDALSDETVIYARYLIQGTLEHLDEVDGEISRYSINRPIEKINLVDRNILRMSVFCLLYSKDLHPSIVIDEAVKLSQSLSTEVTYKFINGLLDALRKQENKSDSAQE